MDAFLSVVCFGMEQRTGGLNMAGLVHLYCGDGKGKTTAAVGLAVRAAGAGKRVLFVQFFKDGSSAEIGILRQLERVRTLHCETAYGLFNYMSDEQKKNAARDYSQLFETALAAAADADLLVLDEAVSACRYAVIDELKLAAFLRDRPENLEVVLTGRKPSERLMALADYITEMKKHKHPFDQGVPAREGIEY